MWNAKNKEKKRGTKEGKKWKEQKQTSGSKIKKADKIRKREILD